MKLKQLHDQVAKNYEAGSYHTPNVNWHNSKQKNHSLSKRIVVTTFLVGTITLIASFYSKKLIWYLLIILTICNYIGTIWFASRMKK